MIGEFFEDVQHGNVRRVFCVVDLAESHVVEAGGVLEKIGDADGISGFPGIFKRDFGGDVLKAGLEIDAAFFFEFEKREGDKGFADGADAELGVAGDFAIGDVGSFADAAAPQELAFGNEGDASAGDVLFFDDGPGGGLEFGEGFGLRRFFFFFRGALGAGKARLSEQNASGNSQRAGRILGGRV